MSKPITLTPREKVVLETLAMFLHTRSPRNEAALHLYCSVSAIDWHLQNIYKKLCVHDLWEEFSNRGRGRPNMLKIAIGQAKRLGLIEFAVVQ